MDIREYIKKNILVFDGAMGTMLQNKGLKVGDLPETLNITNPEIVLEIHKEYVAAGADVITTNTFQASEYKLKDCGYTVEEIVTSGVLLAKKANPKYVALDIGPSGRLLEPLGTVTFDEAYELFKKQMVAGEKAGADLIIMETISDAYEIKAAILAAKENTSLPIISCLTYQQDGRTFTGTDPISGTLIMQSLGVDALGLNCSMGPRELLPIVKEVLKYSKLPVIVQANAGLPKIIDGQTIYEITPVEYASYVSEMLDAGVKIIGGCCGTTPDFIRELRKFADKNLAVVINAIPITAVTSSTQTVILDNKITVIGERINPTGKPKLKEALRNNQIEYILGEAVDQAKNGADILDINVGLPEIDEPATIARVIKKVQSISNLPLQIDSADIQAIEAGLRAYNGRPLVNSVNGKAEVMSELFPIVKKYGAVVVGLTLDEEGIPETANGRYAIAEKIVKTAEIYGIPKEDIIIDCLTLTVSAQQSSVLATLDAIKLVKSRLGVKTVLGVSNVSFGLPNRPLMNSIFLSAAMGAGLDAPILNPMSDEMMRAVDTYRVINCQDLGSARYIKRYSENTESKVSNKGLSETASTNIASPTLIQKEDLSALENGPYYDLGELIFEGRAEEAAALARSLLKTHDPLEIIDNCFVPTLNEVGDGFDRGDIFLPSLMMSAEAVKVCFDVIKELKGPNEVSTSKGKVLVATVLGDIHDIGKNIAKMLLENYGYDVIDLGKDVAIEKIITAAKEHNIKLIGLSALMTTTVKNMKLTISAIREAGIDCKIMVGGAVLNSEYADFVGADYYVKDAREGVEIAKRVF
jgi:5-methyltetrahydrofolate--homocysteine methyltransferase